VGRDLPEAKKDYAPENVLKKFGFTDIHIKNFETSGYFNPQQALKYLQSVSIWNLVSDDMKPATRHILENYCQEKSVAGVIERKLIVKCVVGRIG
jgi:hypothetical protein